MFFTKQDYDYLFESLTKKFSLYDFINENYIKNILDSLMNYGYFEDLNIMSYESHNDMNPLFYIGFKIQNYLYYKICKLCEDDIDVLLCLVEDKRRIINLVLKKLKQDNINNIDDYIMNVASLYNGVESFDSFITRYVMSSIKGIPFNVEKAVVNNTSVISEDTKDKRKKNKKKKNKKNKNRDTVTYVNTESEEKDISAVVVLDSSKTLYDTVLEKINIYLGTGAKDEFISLVLSSDIINMVPEIEDEKFRIYYLLRFGFMNNSFYSREEISNILDINLLDVIRYERFVIDKLREYLNKSIDCYEEYILKK